MIALIDADIIAYMCAHAADGSTWICPDGQQEGLKENAVKYCRKHQLDETKLVHEYYPEDVSMCLHSVKNMCKGILENLNIGDEYYMYLTGKGNFREQIAKTKPYKESRKKNRKPEHLPAAKQYLIDRWGARVVEGQEADDAMGIAQSTLDTDTIICSIDKDLLMIPGKHYIWPHKGKEAVYHTVKPREGLLRFYIQAVSGDSTDDIQGIPGLGPSKAAALFKDISELSKLSDKEFEEVLCKTAFTAYVQYISETNPDKDHNTCVLLAYELFLEMARLVWIRREENQLWTPPIDLITIFRK